jgi:hypothetical protein
VRKEATKTAGTGSSGGSKKRVSSLQTVNKNKEWRRTIKSKIDFKKVKKNLVIK